MTDAIGPRWFFANLVRVKLSQAAARGAMSIVELLGPDRGHAASSSASI
jgi:hypothetical protein